MRQDRMLKASSAKGYVGVRLGQFLNIMKPRLQRVDVGLHNAALEQFEQDASIFGVVLVPRVKYGFAVAGTSQG